MRLENKKENEQILDSTKVDEKNEKLSKRKQYLKEYYQKNKSKAQAYQRMYNIKYKKKIRNTGSQSFKREAIREVFNVTDIMRASPEKTIDIINQIINGKRSLSLNL